MQRNNGKQGRMSTAPCGEVYGLHRCAFGGDEEMYGPLLAFASANKRSIHEDRAALHEGASWIRDRGSEAGKQELDLDMIKSVTAISVFTYCPPCSSSPSLPSHCHRALHHQQKRHPGPGREGGAHTQARSAGGRLKYIHDHGRCASSPRPLATSHRLPHLLDRQPGR
nr:hypothetical protein CFP56_19342 [Quercus suber]